MNSRQRAYLKGIAMTTDPIFQIGKSGLTPKITHAVEEAFHRRELIKISVLQNCLDQPGDMAQMLSERTHSEIVQVIGKKIILYRPAKEEKDRILILPK